MDAFETFVGYRSLFPALTLPDKQALEQLSEEELFQLAKDSFDANVAEMLRSTGEWHWKLEIRDIVEDLAETLSFCEQIKYESLRITLLNYYAEQYHRPTVQEYRMYLRAKKRSRTPREATCGMYLEEREGEYIGWHCDFCHQSKTETQHSCALCQRSLCQDCQPLATLIPGQFIYCRECLSLENGSDWREKLAARVLAKRRENNDPEKKLLALLEYFRVREWAERQQANTTVGVAHSMHYNPFSTYLDVADPYRVHHVTGQVVVAVVLGGHYEDRCWTPSWVQIVLQRLDERKGDKEPITGSQFVSYLEEVEHEQPV